MHVSVGVKAGIKKQICDDTAFVNSAVINDGIHEYDPVDVAIIGVADGVGGNSGGKDASTFIAEHITNVDFKGDVAGIKEQLYSLNNDLLEYASATPDRKQMATTLTAILFAKGKCFLIHIGNTRMYVGQGSYLKQFTQDHTTYQWLLNRGQIEAAESCNKNEISACMGGGNQNLAAQIEVTEVFQDGLPNRLVFTSDGVHEHIEIDRLEEMVFAQKTDNEIIDEIIREVEQNGSDDDKTVVIVRK